MACTGLVGECAPWGVCGIPPSLTQPRWVRLSGVLCDLQSGWPMGFGLPACYLTLQSSR